MVIKCKKNYYDILGVTPDSDNAEVKSSYRNLARKFHPDINKSPESVNKFKDILEAYETLSDEQKRKQYDMLNGFYKTPKSHFKNKPSSESESPKEKEDPFEKEKPEQNKTTTNESQQKEPFKRKNPQTDNYSKSYFKEKVASILDEISKNHTEQERNKKINGDDINTEITITIEEAISGTERLLNIMHKECCPHCKGRKFINTTKCHKCNGTGIFEQLRKITVKIPAGVKSNTKLRLKGEGNPGFFGGRNGDLYININIEKNDNMQIDGNNLLYKVLITPFEAVLGTEINIPHTNGNIKFTIPPMTQSGQKFQIHNKGIKTNDKFGDMIITTEIQIPKNLSKEEINLYGKLKNISNNNIREV